MRYKKEKMTSHSLLSLLFIMQCKFNSFPASFRFLRLFHFNNSFIDFFSSLNDNHESTLSFIKAISNSTTKEIKATKC